MVKPKPLSPHYGASKIRWLVEQLSSLGVDLELRFAHIFLVSLRIEHQQALREVQTNPSTIFAIQEGDRLLDFGAHSFAPKLTRIR